jgi:hypothetical protein
VEYLPPNRVAGRSDLPAPHHQTRGSAPVRICGRLPRPSVRAFLSLVGIAHTKLQHLILCVMLALFSIHVAATTSSFAIYLPCEPVDRSITGTGGGDWSAIRLSESPLLSSADIVSYDFESHSMRLRSDALAKIPRPPCEGAPFVIVANGQRIYVGAFTTLISSMPCALPSIVVDRRLLATNQAQTTFIIERAFPDPSFGVGPDPRGDPRIRRALAALHKLRRSP